jgi:hypothetical protein
VEFESSFLQEGQIAFKPSWDFDNKVSDEELGVESDVEEAGSFWSNVNFRGIKVFRLYNM